MSVDEAVARALEIGPDSSVAERTIDITTIGARSGIPRRIEVWFHRVDGRWYLTGMPGPRGWYANVRAHPRFMVHLKHGVAADLPATAAPVDEQTRRRVITAVLDLQNRPEVARRVSRRQDLDEWLARSPLVEIVFDDEELRTAPSVRSGSSGPQRSEHLANACQRRSMNYRTLGRTGIEVNPYCLGTMMFGAMGNPDHDDSIRIIHKALDTGLGRYREGKQTDTHRSGGMPQHFRDERKLDVVDRLIPLADEAGLQMTHLAMASAIAHPGVTSAIIGPRTMEHLDDLLAGADVTLDDDVLDRIDEIAQPGTDAGPNDLAYTPPDVSTVSLRRRPAGDRSAA